MRIEDLTLVAISKNEGLYLDEWIAYHTLIGFKNIRIYDNQSSDDSYSKLAKWSSVGVVEVVDWINQPNMAAQNASYRDAVSTVQTPWVIFLDIDEFLTFKPELTLEEWLQSIPEDAGAVGLNWWIFGTSNHIIYEKKNVTERFLYKSESNFNGNRHIKTMLRREAVDDIYTMTPHAVVIKPEFRYISPNYADCNNFSETKEQAGAMTWAPEHSTVWINHYVLKSHEEIEMKRKKGQGNLSPEQMQKRLMTGSRIDEDFVMRHDRNEVFDDSKLSLQPQLHSLQAKLQEIESEISLTPINFTLLIVSDPQLEVLLNEFFNRNWEALFTSGFDMFTITPETSMTEMRSNLIHAHKFRKPTLLFRMVLGSHSMRQIIAIVNAWIEEMESGTRLSVGVRKIVFAGSHAQFREPLGEDERLLASRKSLLLEPIFFELPNDRSRTFHIQSNIRSVISTVSSHEIAQRFALLFNDQ